MVSVKVPEHREAVGGGAAELPEVAHGGGGARMRVFALVLLLFLVAKGFALVVFPRASHVLFLNGSGLST